MLAILCQYYFSPATDVLEYSRMQYFRARNRTNLTARYRLFVIYVASYKYLQPSPPILQGPSRSPGTQTFPPSPIPRVIIEKCHICIQSCEGFLRGAVDILDKRSPYLCSISDGALACFIVLFMASQSLYLRHLTPDIASLAAMVTAKLQKWATPGSVFEAQVSIVNSLVGR
jgi:hypothetical protein